MSSNNEYAIQVQDVSKIYKLYDKPIDRLKESLSLTHKNYHRDFFALSDISFNVKKGETVGIIGTNGSGKSTILKIITAVSITAAYVFLFFIFHSLPLNPKHPQDQTQDIDYNRNEHRKLYGHFAYRILDRKSVV